VQSGPLLRGADVGRRARTATPRERDAGAGNASAGQPRDVLGEAGFELSDIARLNVAQLARKDLLIEIEATAVK
jgi:hypothetical protein